MAKFCSTCGAQLPDTANVCSNCGTPLASAQQPAAPQYQQPMGYARPAKSLTDVVVGLLNVAMIVFLALAAVGFLYYFIMAIVNASDAYTSEFRVFMNGFANAIATTARYSFYAVITAIGSKLIKK